ncbi:hypothetical protein Vadar_008172 [Vaccinium darrowii]|uniref:Uncharacterized protein n=1 Tax=Vaccinium darrowii TaxID=229202 RepID=A0ACB7XP10_9ERIC|nr:hypothetical protein Vadar_008172 [Vaccinium darrowii]
MPWEGMGFWLATHGDMFFQLGKASLRLRMDESRYVLELHHGGYFVDFPHKQYLKGNIRLINNVDSDRMSYFEMLDMVKELGFTQTPNIYHLLRDCDLDGGLREIKTNLDVTDMFAIHNERRRIVVYIECKIVSLDGEDKYFTFFCTWSK